MRRKEQGSPNSFQTIRQTLLWLLSASWLDPGGFDSRTETSPAGLFSISIGAHFVALSKTSIADDRKVISTCDLSTLRVLPNTPTHKVQSVPTTFEIHGNFFSRRLNFVGNSCRVAHTIRLVRGACRPITIEGKFVNLKTNVKWDVNRNYLQIG